MPPPAFYIQKLVLIKGKESKVCPPKYWPTLQLTQTCLVEVTSQCAVKWSASLVSGVSVVLKYLHSTLHTSENRISITLPVLISSVRMDGDRRWTAMFWSLQSSQSDKLSNVKMMTRKNHVRSTTKLKCNYATHTHNISAFCRWTICLRKDKMSPWEFSGLSRDHRIFQRRRGQLIIFWPYWWPCWAFSSPLTHRCNKPVWSNIKGHKGFWAFSMWTATNHTVNTDSYSTTLQTHHPWRWTPPPSRHQQINYAVAGNVAVLLLVLVCLFLPALLPCNCRFPDYCLCVQLCDLTHAHKHLQAHSLNTYNNTHLICAVSALSHL